MVSYTYTKEQLRHIGNTDSWFLNLIESGESDGNGTSASSDRASRSQHLPLTRKWWVQWAGHSAEWFGYSDDDIPVFLKRWVQWEAISWNKSKFRSQIVSILLLIEKAGESDGSRIPVLEQQDSQQTGRLIAFFVTRQPPAQRLSKTHIFRKTYVSASGNWFWIPVLRVVPVGCLPDKQENLLPDTQISFICQTDNRAAYGAYPRNENCPSCRECIWNGDRTDVSLLVLQEEFDPFWQGYVSLSPDNGVTTAIQYVFLSISEWLSEYNLIFVVSSVFHMKSDDFI